MIVITGRSLKDEVPHIGDAVVPENVTSEAPTESNEDEVVEEFSGEMV